MLINSERLSENLLERQIDAVKDSINRSRTTWLFATLLTFVIATALYNGTASYNSVQLQRRALLAGVVERDLPGLRAEIAATRMIAMDYEQTGVLTPEQRARLTTLSALGIGRMELGYLKNLLPQNESKAGADSRTDAERLRALRRAVGFEVQAHAARRVGFDTVQIPIIGLSVTGSDIGIVGGMGLALVGYWLLAALRGEAHALGEFIRKEAGDRYDVGHAPYCREESAYAFRAIRHYMIFSVSTKGSPINVITRMGFLIPPLLVLYNHATTAWLLLTDAPPELGGYLQFHVVVEAGIAVLVAAVWIRALRYQLATVDALQAWRQLVEDYDIRPPTRRLRIG